MNDEFWRQFPPIPGFNCMAMKRRAQERVWERIQGMTDRELIAYFAEKARRFNATGKIPCAEEESLLLREKPRKFGPS